MKYIEEILKQASENIPEVVTVIDVKNHLDISVTKAYEIINVNS